MPYVDLYEDIYSDIYGTFSTVAFPSMFLEIAPGYGPLSVSPVWVDITPGCVQIETYRGRQHELRRTEAGTAVFAFDNRDRSLDPTNTSSPYYPYLRPMCPIRVRATWNTVDYSVWSGFITSVAPSRPDQANSESVIHAVDAFRWFNLFQFSASVYAQAVTADAPRAWWRLGDSSGSVNLRDENRLYPLASAGVSLGGSSLLVGDANGSAAFDGTNSYASAIGFLSVTGGLTDFTVEAWVRFDSLRAGYNDIVAIDGGATNLVALRVNAAGKTEFVLATGGGALVTATGTTNIAAGATYHIVGTWVGVTMHLYVNGVEEATASTASGYAEGGIYIGGNPTNMASASDATIDEVAVYPTGLSAARVAAHYAAGHAPWANDSSGTRIGRVLDLMGWPAANRSLDTGQAILQPANLTGTALAHLSAVEDTEAGFFFMDGSGKAVLLDRHRPLKSPRTVSQATFGDGPGEYPYIPGIEIQEDDEDLWNDANVTRENGATQVYSDPTSANTYGKRTASTSGLLSASDNDAYDRAAWTVTHYKDPVPRVRSMSFTPNSDSDNMWPQALGRELWDRITIKSRPVGGGPAFSQPSLIEGIDHLVRPGSLWRTTFRLSPAETQTYWLLGDATYGVLDSTTRLAH